MDILKKYEEIKKVLGRDFSTNLLPELEKKWNAFYNEPTKYNVIVIAMVNQWIDEQ